MSEAMHDPLLTRGGFVTNSNGGQTWFAWAQNLERCAAGEPVIDAMLAERAEAVRVMKTQRTRGRRMRINHERARARLEARGADALALPDRVPVLTRLRRWVVRIYYRSLGDELLAFDVHGLTEQTASALRSDYTIVAQQWPDRAFPIPDPCLFDRDEISPDARSQGRYREPAFGARLVVLPSQHHEQTEICTEDQTVAK